MMGGDRPGAAGLSGETLLLSSADVRRFLPLEECIEAVEEAFRQHGTGEAPPPGVLALHAGEGGFHIKAGVLRLEQNFFCAKINANFPGNAQAHGLPTIQGVVVLCDAQNGLPLAIMDSGEITARRTAAATAVAARYLARPDAAVATVCGCGVQGALQVEALHRVRTLRKVLAYDIQAPAAAELAARLSRKLKLEVVPVEDLREATRQSDICLLCTPAREAYLGSEGVVPGTLVAAVGADNPAKQEVRPGLLAKAKIVVDVLDQAAAMGDLHHALKAGAVSRSDVHAELGEVVAGRKPGRENSEEIILFDSTGMALQDVAAAAAVFRKARPLDDLRQFRFAA